MIKRNTTIDFHKVKGYKSKDWLAEEEKMVNLKGKINKWRASGSEGFVEVKNKKLFYNKFQVTAETLGGKKTIFKPYKTYRYGRFKEKIINKHFIDYLKKFMRPFKV